MTIYLAAPVVTTDNIHDLSLTEERLSRNKIIKEKLESKGFDVYLPQDHKRTSGADIFRAQIEAIKKCEFLILMLSDTRGIYIEAGYAKALGKRVYALEVEETRKYSDWMTAFCNFIARDIDELMEYLKENEQSL